MLSLASRAGCVHRLPASLAAAGRLSGGLQALLLLDAVATVAPLPPSQRRRLLSSLSSLSSSLLPRSLLSVPAAALFRGGAASPWAEAVEAVRNELKKQRRRRGAEERQPRAEGGAGAAAGGDGGGKARDAEPERPSGSASASASSSSSSSSPSSASSPRDKRESRWDLRPERGLLLLALLAAALLLMDGDSALGAREITFQDFRNQLLETGRVERLAVRSGAKKVLVFTRPEGVAAPSSSQLEQEMEGGEPSSASARPTPAASRPSSASASAFFRIGSVEAFERALEEAQREMGLDPRDYLQVKYEVEGKWLSTLLSAAPVLLMLFFTVQLLRQLGGGAGGGGGGRGRNIFSMGRSPAQLIKPGERTSVTFADVAGLDEAKVEVMEFVKFLKSPEQFTRLGAKIPKGALLCGPPGTGKCFAAGTMLRLYDGSCIAVERITGGELLMGDDSQPRLVCPGSLARGRSLLFRVQPEHDGAAAFTVNGEHILVLLNADTPSVRRLRQAGQQAWQLNWYAVDKSNAMRLQSRAFSSQAEAAAERQRLQSSWSPLLWEVALHDFLAAPDSIRRRCRLVQSGPVSFESPAQPQLAQVLASLLGAPCTGEQRDWAAWFLGLWLTRGSSSASTVSCLLPDWLKAQSPAAVGVLRRLLECGSLFGQPALRCCSAGGEVLSVQFASGSLPFSLLRAYGLLDGSLSVPHAWLCDSLQVRRLVLAGAIDGCGRYDAGLDEYELRLQAQQRRLAAGLKLLAASLGLRNGAVTGFVEQQGSGSGSVGHRLLLSGQMWQTAQHCQTAALRCPQPADSADEALSCAVSRSFGFSVSPVGEAEYFGFAVQGSNRRFLLEDFTVTHNVSSSCSSGGQPQRQQQRQPG